MRESTAPARPAAVADPGGLLAALSGPDPEPALESALQRLAAGGDLRLLLATAIGLVRAGVAGLAARLLAATPEAVRARADVQAAMSEIEMLPAGGEPVAARAAVADAHRRAIAKHYDLVLPAGEGTGGLHVFTTRSGNRHVVRDREGGGLRFVFPFVDQRRHAAAVDLPPAVEGSSFLLLGMPSVALLERLLGLCSAGGYRPPVDIVETDAAVFDLWLHLLDPQAASWFDGRRLALHVGPGALAQYAAARTERHWRGEPTHTLTNHRPGWTPPPADAAWRRAVQERVNERRRALIARQSQRVDGRDDRALGRLDGAAPLRVLALTTRYSTVIRHAMRDLASAFGRHGHRCEVLTEPTDCDREIDTWTALAERDYDLVVVINHLRAELGDRIDARIPYACWIQDQMTHLWTTRAGASVTGRDLVIGRDKWTMCRVYGYPSARFLPAVNVTDAHTYDSAPVEAALRDRFACDVSFVSHGAQTPEEMIESLQRAKGRPFGDYLRGVVRRMDERLSATGWLPFFTVLECMDEAERDTPGVALTPGERRHHVHPVVASLADRIIRHQALRWAAAWARGRGRTLRIHGRGWEEHPTLAEFAAGEISNGRQLRALYQASAVSLQVNAYGSHHQRLLDGVASGGLVLSRYNPFDFLRPALETLQAKVRTAGIASLEELARCAAGDADLTAILRSLEELGWGCLQPLPDERRARQARLLRDVFAFPPEELTDEAVFASWCRSAPLPHRLAADLTGFRATVFADEAHLHELLDRLADDPGARRALAEPLRADILAHDTYDALVPRIIAAFRGGPEESKSPAPCTG